ncbi:hypothetical protein WICMUC_001756 [Wickerhamomyces mucosus]|uniref:Integrase catalytic domain-containing protein n=1 Tax=Wickerhamomyces mucosus TaxID=1378264 RepID=A0A9P8PT94_9ASCO|nr:hypothetical protein WICMUC_001756 [Wickerhamomyces mucosus]
MPTHLNQGRLARWLDFLSEFDFTIKHIPGVSNSAADALSRRDDDNEVELQELSIQTVELDAIENELQNEANEYIQTINENLKEEFIQGYTTDPDTKIIMQCLQNPSEVPPKNIRAYIKHFRLENGFLLFAVLNGESYRIVVPNYQNLRNRLISNVHDLPSGSHFSYLRAYEILHRQFYWHKMLRSIKKYVNSCIICQKSKPSTQLTQGLIKPLPIPAGRFQEVTLDFLTGIPRSTNGSDTILVIVDRFSKRAKMIACKKTITGQETAELFIRHYFTNYGIPRKIVSDKDVRFMGSFWKTIWTSLGTSLLFTTTAHPQTDGQSERMMRILNQSLRAVCHNNLVNWEKLLPAVEFAYNSTVQASTKKAPFEIDDGLIPDAPTYSSTWHLDNSNANAEDYSKELKAISLQTKDQLIEAQRQMEKQANKKRRDVEFKVGEWVLLHKNVWGTRDAYGKLYPYYIGPYQIVKKLNNNAVEIALESTSKKQRTINVQWLRHFIERDDKYAKKVPRTELEIQQRINEINAIVGWNTDHNKLTVTWSNCDPKHCSVIAYEEFDKMTNSSLKKQLLEEAELLMKIPEEFIRIKDPSQDPSSVKETIARLHEDSLQEENIPNLSEGEEEENEEKN